MDAPTLSAYAAGIAAFFAGAVGAIQLYVGHRQSKAALKNADAAMMTAKSTGRRTVAASRQEWINTVIETLSEYHALLLSGEDSLSPEDAKRMAALRTKLEILLNPNESDTVALVAAADNVRLAKTLEERQGKSPEIVAVARTLLKREWVRIKDEVQKID